MIPEDFNLDAAMGYYEKAQNMCKMLMQTKHYQAMGEVGIFAIIQKAKSLNMDIFDALGGSLYFINGKVGMSSQAMNALIRRAGGSISQDAKSNHLICILTGQRADNGNTLTCSFSIEEAKSAGLMKNMYEKYPKAMLFNRCVSMLARQLFPDIIKGAGYTQDELKEIKNVNPNKESTFELVDELLSLEQINKLEELLRRCPLEVIDKFYQFIKNPPISANCLGDINKSHFQSIMDLVQKRCDKDEADKKPKETVKESLFDVDAIEKDIAENGVLVE